MNRQELNARKSALLTQQESVLNSAQEQKRKIRGKCYRVR